MLVLPNRDVWTFEALDDKVDLEDSVFLAGNDGPRRTAVMSFRGSPSSAMNECAAGLDPLSDEIRQPLEFMRRALGEGNIEVFFQRVRRPA